MASVSLYEPNTVVLPPELGLARGLSARPPTSLGKPGPVHPILDVVDLAELKR